MNVDNPIALGEIAKSVVWITLPTKTNALSEQPTSKLNTSALAPKEKSTVAINSAKPKKK